MFTRVALVATTAMLLAMPAFAQTAAPAAAPAPAAPAATTPAPAASASSEMTKDGKPRMKVVREACKEETKTGGLKGDARRQAMADCIIKQRPDMEAKIKCSMDPSLKGMEKDARKVAVKACVDKSKT